MTTIPDTKQEAAKVVFEFETRVQSGEFGEPDGHQASVALEHMIEQALIAAEKRGREEARTTIIAAHDLLRADDRYGALAHLPAGGVECEEMVEKAVDLLAAAIRSTN